MNPQCESETAYEGEDWIIAEWPDGTWCNREDLHEYSHMSDDYTLARVLTYDVNGYVPIKTQRI